MTEHTAENDAPVECYGCFWDMRPGPWHTCRRPVVPPVVTWCAEHGSLPGNFQYKQCPWCPTGLDAEEIR